LSTVAELARRLPDADHAISPYCARALDARAIVLELPMRRIVMTLAAAAIVFSGVAKALDFTIGSIKIEHPWMRATPKGAQVAGGYMKISNSGTAADRLVGGSTEIAARLEIHRMSMDGGVMRMRPVEGGLEIKPGASVELKPGSFHIMLMGLREPVEQGKRVKGTLVFEKAGTVEVEYVVEAMGATESTHPSH
jgi:copper(I)-binding protein